MKSYKRWTAEDKKYIKENYMRMTDEELGEKLGRSVMSVRHKRTEMKLFKKVLKRDKKVVRPNRLKVKKGNKDLEELESEKESLVLDVLNAYDERKGHDHLCDCKKCKKLNDKEWELVLLNTRIRRAKNIPPSGVSSLKGVIL